MAACVVRGRIIAVVGMVMALLVASGGVAPPAVAAQPEPFDPSEVNREPVGVPAGQVEVDPEGLADESERVELVEELSSEAAQTWVLADAPMKPISPGSTRRRLGLRMTRS